MNRPRWWLAGVALPILVALAWLTIRFWFPREKFQQRSSDLNVILITIDTLRADHVSAYGGNRASTPALDALAYEGVRFDHCVCQVPLTLPSHVSLLSATYPLYNLVRDNGAFLVPEALTLISEVLQTRGMDTAAFIGAFVLHSKWGLNQGFSTYSDRFDMGRYGKILLQNEKRADEVLGDAKRWLETRGEKRFFAWIHLYDPHSPYSPAPPFAARFPDDLYRGEVEYTDSELGKFINFLKEKGLYDNSLIIVAADHGEGLGEHGEMEHGMFLYETTVHVPLIIHAPRPFARRTVTETVQLVDVAPTVLDLLGIPAPAQWQGRSLWPLLAGKADSRFGLAYSETYYPRFHYGWSHLQAITNHQRKYILAPRDELYDLERDPKETDELAGDRQRGDLRAQLMAFISRFSRGALGGATGTHQMSAEDQRRLAALGYLSGTVKVDEQASLADPKDKLAAYTALAKATALVFGKRWAEAVSGLRRLVEEEPELADAWSLMGNAYLALRRHQEALDAFRRALALKPDNNFLMLNILKTLAAMGKTEVAASENLRFLKVFPKDAALLEELGYIRLLQRRPDEALAALRQAMAIDPAASQSFNLAGEALIMKKDYTAAEAILRQGIRENPRAKNTHYLLAQVQESLGRTDQALELYRQELEINPGKFEAAVNLANYYKQAGRIDEAARYYRMAIDSNGMLKLPRFHLAEIMLKKGENMREAVDLCLQGIDMPPRDRETLFGYFVLTNLYAALGNAERRDFYTRQGEKLIATLGR